MKVLILTAKYGMGHMSASKSISDDILKFNSAAEISVVDLYQYSMPVLSDYLYSFFGAMLKYSSKTYIKYYNSSDKSTENIDLITRKLSYSVERLVMEEKPDVLISTFPIISKAVSLYKERMSVDIPLVTCITDVSSHYEWISKNTDKYIVPCIDVKYDLIKKGVNPDRIVVYGIPISKKFRESFAQQAFSELHSNLVNISKYNRKKELLIMGGGLGILPKTQDFYRKLNSTDGLHVTIVTGNNRKMYNSLKDRYENITVLGYSENVSELMYKADCVVTKPGGITLFESIYSLTPIISFMTELPNELRNIDFIEDNNFGISLHSKAEENVDRIIKFINDSSKIEGMKMSMKKFVNSLDSDYFDNYLQDIHELNEIYGNEKYAYKIGKIAQK
ncbi:MGDG synthase family glycosyltransferase [Peptostreptococcus porci]|uniref:MGDG synthase family glycosyltransferase n=1 Tax=Peptostreptococcus porci TaxID=2652282 RepID=UPI002A82FDA0|nr:galactosyldiacylglycerol synthase [Peptostreptococcus porci]MDY4128919.1 galactosyldiacylglycerol synthase [Peptostreptococcus porci]